MAFGWRAKLREILTRQFHPGRGMAKRGRDRIAVRRQIPYVHRWVSRAEWTAGGVSFLAIVVNSVLLLGWKIELWPGMAVMASTLVIFVIAVAFFETSLAERARAASFQLCPQCLHDLNGGVAHEVANETDTTMTCPECAWSVRVGENSKLWRRFVEEPLPQERLLRALMRWGGR